MRGEAALGGQKGKAELAALQAALAAEQVASYGYGIVGSHLAGSKSRFAAASADCVAHERARDSLVRLITALGGKPSPAAVAYRLPAPVSSSVTAVSLAITLERDVTAAYLGLVAVTRPSLREFAAGQMQASAARATRWSGRSQAFPGLSASAARH